MCVRARAHARACGGQRPVLGDVLQALSFLNIFPRFHSVMVVMSALPAEGPGFEPQWNHDFHCTIYCLYFVIYVHLSV